MTHHIDQELQLLQAQIIHKKRLDAMLAELRRQYVPLKRKTETLRQIKYNEQADVDRMEKRSLTAYFLYSRSRRNAMLIQEQKEAYVARMKYDAAKRELEALSHDIEETEDDLAALGNCEARFMELIAEKTDSIHASDSPDARKLLEMEKELSYLEGQIRELQEAITAGSIAMQTVNTITACLARAEEWRSYDMPGSAFFLDAARQEQLDIAQDAVESLQVQLQRLNKELQDVSIRENLQTDIRELLMFADHFFDNLGADLPIPDRVENARAQTSETYQHLQTILRQLGNSLEALRHRQQLIRQELDNLIITIHI